VRKFINKKIAKLLNCFIATTEKNNLTMQQCNNRKFCKGFTLVELLVVIAVVGILSGTVITLINPANYLKKGRDTQRKSDLSVIQSALEIFKADLGVYPFAAQIPTCGNPLIGGAPASTYLRRYPCDPRNTGQHVYRYVVSAGNASYSLIACLENTSDLQKDPTNNSAYCTGGTTNWSYTVQSP